VRASNTEKKQRARKGWLLGPMIYSNQRRERGDKVRGIENNEIYKYYHKFINTNLSTSSTYAEKMSLVLVGGGGGGGGAAARPFRSIGYRTMQYVQAVKVYIAYYFCI